MKTIQEIKDAKAILENEISFLIAKFQRENWVDISNIMVNQNRIENEMGEPIDNIIEVIVKVEF